MKQELHTLGHTLLTKPRPWLKPLAWLYGAVVWVRNRLYNQGILSTKSFDVPVICVGNVVVGGGGKTPMVEYLIRNLSAQYKVAVVSRGYKRKTRGLQVATLHSTVKEIGDEPALLKRKYPKVQVVVDGNRQRAIKYLCQLPQETKPDVIIMDDGLQHRSVKPSYTFLMTPYESLTAQSEDLLPAGRLREPLAEAMQRVDIIVGSKCPKYVSPLQEKLLERELALFPHQRLLLSQIKYQAPQPLFSEEVSLSSPLSLIDTHITVIAGIASPALFFKQVSTYSTHSPHFFSYPDHYRYREKDFKQWETLFNQTKEQEPTAKQVFLCTEKDAVKLQDCAHLIPASLRSILFYLPIRIAFKASDDELIGQELESCFKHFRYISPLAAHTHSVTASLLSLYHTH